MKTVTTVAACLLLASCGVLNPEQVQGVLEVVNAMQNQGSITAEQGDALRQALLENSGEPWWQQIGRVVLEVGLAVAGIRWWRGPSASPAERVARIAARAKIDKA